MRTAVVQPALRPFVRDRSEAKPRAIPGGRQSRSGRGWRTVLVNTSTARKICLACFLDLRLPLNGFHLGWICCSNRRLGGLERLIPMSYIAVTLNHFRAIQEWATSQQAEVRLDMKTFRVEVQRGPGRCVLHPQFLNTAGGSLSYSPVLSPAATGFIGWLPYRAIKWPLSDDKLEFKSFLRRSGILAPATWPSVGEVDKPFVLKQPVGSFGQAVFGPYQAGVDALSLPEHRQQARERAFAEQFISGRNIKAWFWGGEPFHLHLHPYPAVSGDGDSPDRGTHRAAHGPGGRIGPGERRQTMDRFIPRIPGMGAFRRPAERGGGMDRLPLRAQACRRSHSSAFGRHAFRTDRCRTPASARGRAGAPRRIGEVSWRAGAVCPGRRAGCG